MRKLILFILFTITCILSYASEPGTNVGRSISQLRHVFPHLTHTKTDYQGEHYYDGEDPTEGITCFFTVKNNMVVEECMMISTPTVSRYNGGVQCAINFIMIEHGKMLTHK